MMRPLTLTLYPPTNKMVKHTQIIYWQMPSNCLSVSDHFVGLTLKGLNGLTRMNLKNAAMSLFMLIFTN